jgi:hypothetical protein
MGKHAPSPNDQRSNAMNPNNAAYHHAEANRAAQLEAQREAPPPPPSPPAAPAPTATPTPKR